MRTNENENLFSFEWLSFFAVSPDENQPSLVKAGGAWNTAFPMVLKLLGERNGTDCRPILDSYAMRGI